MNLYMAISQEVLDYPEWFSYWEKIDKNRFAKGCEIQTDLDFEKFAKQIYPMDLQIHGLDMTGKTEGEIREYFKRYEKPAGLLKHKVKVTLHPFPDCDVANEISKDYEIQLAWENKGYYTGFFTKGNLCWDICHDIGSGNTDYYLPEELRIKLVNIHLSDMKGKEMHYPFDSFMVKPWVVAKRLKEYGYKESVVLEMWINYFKGKTVREKLNGYLRQFEFVKWNL